MLLYTTSNYTETEEQADVLLGTENVFNLVVYNDDVNTFEFVIQSFIEICGHEAIQAEQCTFLVHYAGRCAVKTGTFNELESICTALLDRGLSAKIE